MDEWWTYTLSDLLLFSPRTYYRMLERHNQAIWPAQILTLALGLGILGLLRRAIPWQGRIISSILAILWGWVASAFLWKRYATINPAATYFAWLFAIEALLFVWLGVIRGRVYYSASRDVTSRLGVALFALALACYPLIGPIAGASRQAEIFGIFPDSTAIATVGLLLLTDGWSRWGLLVVPLLWCVITGATLWALGSPTALIAPVAGLLAVAAARRLNRPEGRKPSPRAL